MLNGHLFNLSVNRRVASRSFISTLVMSNKHNTDKARDKQSSLTFYFIKRRGE
jgi:hypothetical protein